MTDPDEFMAQIDALSRAALTPMGRPVYLTDEERRLLRLVLERYMAQVGCDPYMTFDARRHVEVTGREIRRKLKESA